MKNKKTKVAIIGVIALVLVTVGITYAYWLITRTQTKTNVIGAGCLDISLSDEQNDISLQNQFPLSDEDGMKLTPYTFTVTNNCNTSVDYQLNLELLGDSETSLQTSSIKIMLDENTPILLSEQFNDSTTIEGAYESRRLVIGTIAAKGNVAHSLRLWLDKDAPIEEMNKSFESKISVSVGQGIVNPIKEGTLAYDIVSNYGGVNKITSLSAEWMEGEFEAETPVQYLGKYYWGTDYEFDSEIGYTLSGKVVQATLEDCRATEGLCGKYTLRAISSDATSDELYLVTSFESDSGDGYFTAKKKIAYNDFSDITTADYAALHKAQDDYGISYYFRGAISNNYVKFGTWNEDITEVRGYYSTEGVGEYRVYNTIEECQNYYYANNNCSEVAIASKGDDMYWRIVRINGDGTIRMIYDGTEAVANGTSHAATIGKTVYNTNEDDAKYVGYTYEEEGIQVDSTIKSMIDAWYDMNLEENYGKYVADSIFCNDRTSRTTEDGNTYYGSYDRLYVNKIPQLTCSQFTDKYTVNTEYGNGYLTNPVGLITIDEVMMAGAVNSKENLTYYLYSGNYHWTNTPVTYYGYANVWYVDNYVYSSGGATVSNNWYVRPTLNLKADIKFAGEGTIDLPYEIITE